MVLGSYFPQKLSKTFKNVFYKISAERIEVNMPKFLNPALWRGAGLCCPYLQKE
jgi:hypothetical protein